MKFQNALMSFVPVLLFGRLLFAAPGGVVVWGTKSYVAEWYTDTAQIAGKPVTDAVAISAGRNHALILRAGRTVVGWGDNRHGQAIPPSSLKNVIQIAAGDNLSLALGDDGKISAWGFYKIRSDAVVDAIAISAGSQGRALALRRDGSVFSWSDKVGSPPRLTNIVAIAAGGGDFERDLAIRKDGAVAARGDENVPQYLSSIVAIAVGQNHSLALKTDGTVLGWGDNSYWQATGMASANESHAAGLVVYSGQVLSNVVAIAAGNEYGQFGMGCRYSLALKRDGTVVGWGMIHGKPVSVPEGLSNVVAIAAGQSFCMAITTNSAVAERFRRR